MCAGIAQTPGRQCRMAAGHQAGGAARSLSWASPAMGHRAGSRVLCSQQYGQTFQVLLQPMPGCRGTALGPPTASRAAMGQPGCLPGGGSQHGTTLSQGMRISSSQLERQIGLQVWVVGRGHRAWAPRVSPLLCRVPIPSSAYDAIYSLYSKIGLINIQLTVSVQEQV